MQMMICSSSEREKQWIKIKSSKDNVNKNTNKYPSLASGNIFVIQIDSLLDFFLGVCNINRIINC